jgi:hypothetical protein
MTLAELLTHTCYTVSNSAEVLSHVHQAFHSDEQLLPHGMQNHIQPYSAVSQP